MDELKVVNIRLVKEPSLYSEKRLETPKAVIEFMAEEMAAYDREILCVLNLKSNCQVINMNIVSIGCINATIVSPREVFKSAILSNASGMIALHNHPSGSIRPSREDVRVTRQLIKGGRIMGIELMDHIIVGGASGEMYSFREERREMFLEREDELER